MAGKVQLRDYQQEAIDSILNEPEGSKLILALAVGLP
jgi:superfamily II DNA or RNA helicase